MADGVGSAVTFEQQHPWHVERAGVWDYNQHHYEGGRSLTTGSRKNDYLIKFALEEDSYNARAQRAPGLYHNLVRSSINVYTSQIYRVDPKRNLPSKLRPFEADVDLDGTTAVSYFKRTSVEAIQKGQCYTLVNAPVVPEGAGQDEVQGLRPWFELIPAQNLIDWDVEKVDPDRRGQLNYAVVRDWFWRRPGPFQKATRVMRYRVWVPDQYQVWEQVEEQDDKPRQVAEGPSISRVPIVPHYDTRIGPMQGETIIDDVSLAANAIWNQASVADEGFQYHGFNLLCITTREKLDKLELGSTRAIRLNSGEDAKYLAPSAVPFDAFLKNELRSVERVADLVFARTSRELPSAQVQSEGAKDLERQEFVALLENKAGIQQAAEQDCWNIANEYLGAAPDAQEAEIEYNRQFRVDTSTAEEWEQRTRNGISSLAEWYQSLHPGVEDEEAWERIKENLEKLDEVSGLRRTEDANLDELNKRAQESGEQPHDDEGEGKPPPEDEEDEEAAAA